MDNPQLYRKRLIPFETIHLKDDIILKINDDIILTKWNVLKPKKEFSNGYSCYFLKKGYKISKFLDNKGNLVYYYCDIISVDYNKYENSYVFTDLLADVIVYENGNVRVVDLGEISIAMDQGLISDEKVKFALTTLDNLLNDIYSKGIMSLVGDFFDA